MKIYFCDICNESIPLKDINSNRISIEEGKIFCQKCAPKKVKSGERVPTAVTAILAALVIALLALSYVGWKSLRDAEARTQQVEQSLASIQGTVGSLPDRLTGLEEGVAELENKAITLRDNLSTASSELQQRFNGLDERERRSSEGHQKSLSDGIDRLESGMGADIAALKTGLSDFKVSLEGHKVQVDGLKEKIDLLQDVVTGRGTGAASGLSKVPLIDAASGADGEGDSSDKGKASAGPTLEDREVDDHIAKLSDTDPGKRYAAVIALGMYTGDKVEQALQGALADPKDYVRVAVLHDLEKLGSATATAKIISCLRDKDYFVRIAARRALRSITGQAHDFDPDGSPSEREASVKAWEKWWAANKESALKKSKD